MYIFFKYSPFTSLKKKKKKNSIFVTTSYYVYACITYDAYKFMPIFVVVFFFLLYCQRQNVSTTFTTSNIFLISITVAGRNIITSRHLVVTIVIIGPLQSIGPVHDDQRHQPDQCRSQEVFKPFYLWHFFVHCNIKTIFVHYCFSYYSVSRNKFYFLSQSNIRNSTRARRNRFV